MAFLLRQRSAHGRDRRGAGMIRFLVKYRIDLPDGGALWRDISFGAGGWREAYAIADASRMAEEEVVNSIAIEAYA